MAVSPELLSKALPTSLGATPDVRNFPGCLPEIEEVVSLDGSLLVGITQVPGQPMVRNSPNGSIFEITAPAYSGYFLNYLAAKGLPIELTIAAEDSYKNSDYIIVDCFVANQFSHHHVLIGYKSFEDARTDLEVLCPVMFSQGAKNITSRISPESFRNWLESDNLHAPFIEPKKSTTEVILDTGKETSPYFQISTTSRGRRVSVVISDAIGGWNDRWQALANIITDLDATDELIIAISSPGGNTQTAFTFISFMEICRARVITLAIGHCASAAPVIWSAGKERYLTEAAGMMIHGILMSGSEQLPTQKFTEFGNFCKEVTYGMLRNTVGKIGLVTDDEIRDSVEKSGEFFFSAEEVSQRTGSPILKHGLAQILNEGAVEE